METLTQHFQSIFSSHKSLNTHIKQTDLNQIKIPSSPLPLLTHQIEGVKKLISILKFTSAALFDEQGLGKTYQTLLTLKYFLKNSKFLVVVPNQLIANWIQEIGVFDCFSTGVYSGGQQSRIGSEKSCMESNIILTTHSNIGQKFLRQFHFKITVVDEIHLFQSTKTEFYRNLMKIDTKRFILLTGTPLQVKLEGLFLVTSIMLKDTRQLIQKVQEFDQSDDQKSSTYSKLFSLIKNQFIRREIVVLEDRIPDYEETIIEIDQEQKGQIIERRRVACASCTLDNSPELCIQIVEFLVAKSKTNFFEVQKLLGKISFIDIRTSYLESLLSMSKVDLYKVALKVHFPGDKSLFFGKVERKTELIIQYIQESDIQKFIIFSQFIAHLDVLEHFLPFDVFRIDGNTENVARTQILNNFKLNHGQKSVLLLTYPIGNVGLNITEAKCIIFSDFGYNPNEIKQSISRSVRIGQRDIVQVVYFVSGDVEKQIFRDIRRKLSRNDKVLKTLMK